MYPHEHGMELHNHGEGHTYLEPDWHASGHDAQLPALSTMGRGPRGEGLYIDNVVQEDGNVSFGLYSTLTKECVWQSPNLAAPKINFNAVDWHDLVPGEATPLDITVESDGTTKTTTAYLPSGQQGSLVYLYGETIERTAHDVYQVAADDLCIYGSKTYPAKPTPRVNDIVIFSWTKPNEYGFAFGTIEAVEEGQVVFTARTFVPGVPGDTWYGDPVTVEHGGTGHSNGNGIVWYGVGTGTAVDKVLDIECTIEDYTHAVGNFLIIKLPNISTEVQLNNLTIHSEDNDEGIEYKMKGVGVLSIYAISPSVAANRGWILPLVVTTDTVASSVNGAMFPNEPEFSRNLISTPNAFSHTTLEAAYSNDANRYYASNIGINLERNLYDHIDQININYFDIVISNIGQNSAINNRGIYLRYRTNRKNVIGNTMTSKIITAPPNTVGLQTIFPNLSKSGELPYTMLAAVNITSDQGNHSYVLDQHDTSATVITADGTNVATIQLYGLTDNGVDAKVEFSDPGKLLTNATIDVVWCFLVAETPYYERGVVSDNYGITYYRCGHRVVIDFNKTLISDTTSFGFSLPASISPYGNTISGYTQTQLPYPKKYAVLSSDVVNDDPDPSSYTKLAKVEIKVDNGDARVVVTPLTSENNYFYKLDYTFEYIV